MAVISETISHYHITSKLGAGGMGEVYLAEDSRLGRQVALKFLPASYQYDPDRRARFMKEARAASALRSPYIAAIYDIGEHDGSMFIVMEYVEGELLQTRIGRGPIAPREVIEIAEQVADALDEAHGLGIIHRDVKSANLILTPRGLVKMLDFGLAKINELRTPAASSDDFTTPLGQQTAAGLVLGTVTYMSPEQALGRDLDGRSDLFSLGIVMYEMLTGQLPFRGSSATEIIDHILHDEPTAVAQLNADTPAELERLVRKCLEKDRDRRYQSARELSIDLRNLKRDMDSGALSTSALRSQASGVQTARRRQPRRAIDSLAILPLANESLDAETEYLADGITESIINNLSQIAKLRVMARSTVFRYKGRDVDPISVGHELGVRAVLVGRMLSRGDTLIIKVELVDTADGSHLWGENYNRQMAHVFAIEADISSVISEKLRLRLDSAQKKRLTKRHTEKTEAYQLYLKGRACWNRRTPDSLKQGIEYFNQAIAADPCYALAYAGLADSYNILASYSAMAPDEAFPKAREAATQALRFDERLPEAHASMAFVTFGYSWDFAQADQEFRRALELNPGYAVAHQWYALFLAAMRRTDEAIVEIGRAEQLDPLSLPIITNKGWIFYLARRNEAALATLNRALELDPDFVLAHRRLGQVYEAQGRFADARREYERCLQLAPNDVESLAALGHAYGASNDAERAREIINRLTGIAQCHYVPAFLIAMIHIGLGDLDAAFAWLEKACEEHYGFLTYINVGPVFDPLRNDPRLVELTARIGI
ncbi:MAG TPA: protein kinase [Blastocatellia bacterium]|nr:protein kinase [Blastocatellia bacterium]